MLPAEEVRYLILAAQREGNRMLTDALRPLDLTPSKAEVLRVLQDHAPLSLVGLGERLVCETGSPSRLVAGMVRAGLVEQRRSAEDERKVMLSLTPTGQAAASQVAEIEAGMYAAMNQVLAGAPVTDLTALLWRFVAGRPAGRALALRLPERPSF